MIRERVEALRRLMEQEGIQAYIIPGRDPHRSEVTADYWNRRRFISGFTGSFGNAVVWSGGAGVWTDSRYFIQAEQELDPEVFTLFKKGLPETPSLEAWLVRNLTQGEKTGVDSRLLSCKEYERLEEKLARKAITLCALDENLVDRIWHDRPESPGKAVRKHALSFAGETVKSKLGRLRERLARAGAEA